MAAAEANESERVIASLTTTLVFRILLFYIGSVALIVAVVPWNTIKPGVSPFATTLDVIGIPGASLGMTVIVLVAVLSCSNSGIYVASRVLFTLAGKGDAPQWLVQIDKRGVPSRAILLGAAISLAVVGMQAAFPDTIFAFLNNASGALMIFVYMGVVAAHLILRPKTPPEKAASEDLVHLVSGWLVIAAMLAVLVAMALMPARSVELYASLLCAAFVVACYFVFRREKKAAAESSVGDWNPGNPP